MLIVTELAEAVDANRKGVIADRVAYEQAIGNGEDPQKAFENYIKDSYEDELADTLIRIWDLAGKQGIDLEWHTEQKLKYNSNREHKHGKKY